MALARPSKLAVARSRITPEHIGTRRCQSKMALERDPGQSGRMASVDPTNGTSLLKLYQRFQLLSFLWSERSICISIHQSQPQPHMTESLAASLVPRRADPSRQPTARDVGVV
jgi:hypothetical protein